MKKKFSAQCKKEKPIEDGRGAAAIRIQSIHRGNRDRKKMRNVRENKNMVNAAVFIQARVRGATVRREVKKNFAKVDALFLPMNPVPSSSMSSPRKSDRSGTNDVIANFLAFDDAFETC